MLSIPLLQLSSRWCCKTRYDKSDHFFFDLFMLLTCSMSRWASTKCRIRSVGPSVSRFLKIVLGAPFFFRISSNKSGLVGTYGGVSLAFHFELLCGNWVTTVSSPQYQINFLDGMSGWQYTDRVKSLVVGYFSSFFGPVINRKYVARIPEWKV
jgi:hypothetical protein